MQIRLTRALALWRKRWHDRDSTSHLPVILFPVERL